MTLVRPIRSQWRGEVSLGFGELRAVSRFVHQRHPPSSWTWVSYVPSVRSLSLSSSSVRSSNSALDI